MVIRLDILILWYTVWDVQVRWKRRAHFRELFATDELLLALYICVAILYTLYQTDPRCVAAMICKTALPMTKKTNSANSAGPTL